MRNNVEMVQKQIKAFNKALSRADKASAISGDFYRAINDLIDYERMTKSGYAKAGAKYLENMTPEELLSYSADIEQAKNLVELSSLEFKLDIEGAKDSKSLLWKLYDKLDAAGFAFDSEQVKAVAEGEVNINYKDFAFQMYRYLNDKDYGLSDVQAWFDEQLALEED